MANRNPALEKAFSIMIGMLYKRGGKALVRERMYSEIQGYKQIGYSIRRCARETDIDRKTVRKYWNMSAEEYLKYLAESRERAKILDPYRDEIVAELETHPNITSAIIYDHLRENHEDFKPSYRSVRLYAATLREEMGIPTEVKIRQYAEVAEQPPGFQAQVDMGQKVMMDPFGHKVKIYIFAMVMSHSRKKYVYFRERPFNALDFIEAHDLAFKYYGGRTQEIVYDQDRVMAVSENAGDLVLTDIFENYRKYAGFTVRLCRGFDPESKGKIESVVKYVKGNLLACRNYHGISVLNSEGLAWLDRTANAKIHETTKMIPDSVFAEEIKHLKQVPSLSKPIEPATAVIRKTNVIHYKQNRYEVPNGTYYPGREVRINTEKESGKITFFDKSTGELLAEHTLAYGVGKLVRLPKHADRYVETKYDDLRRKVIEKLTDIETAGKYIDMLIEKYPRYARDQLRIMKNCMEQYCKDDLRNAFCYCLERDLISANDFRDTLEYFRSEQPVNIAEQICLPEKYKMIRPKVRSVESYVTKAGGGSI
jgi:transposase